MKVLCTSALFTKYFLVKGFDVRLHVSVLSTYCSLAPPIQEGFRIEGFFLSTVSACSLYAQYFYSREEKLNHSKEPFCHCYICHQYMICVYNVSMSGPMKLLSAHL